MEQPQTQSDTDLDQDIQTNRAIMGANLAENLDEEDLLEIAQ